MEAEHSYIPIDPLIYFFQDIAKLPIVSGKNEYLLLTRRVQRARLLQLLITEDSTQTLHKIRTDIKKTLEAFNQQIDLPETPLVEADLTVSIESFLSDAYIREPACFAKYNFINEATDKGREPSDLGWRSFYLISLIPPSLRNESNNTLSEAELDAHFKLILKEGKEAKQELITGTLRYVIRIARLYTNSGIPYLDLVQEGFIGLSRAVDTFDEQLGAHFQSHAASWIRQRIGRYIADNARLIRVPVHQLEAINAIQQKIDEVLDKTGSLPSEIEIYQALEWLSTEDVQQFNRLKLYDHVAQIKTRVEKYSSLLQYLNVTTDEIPPSQLEKVTALLDKQDELTKKLGRTPSEVELFSCIGWISDQEAKLLIEFDRNPSIEDKQANKLHAKLWKAQKQMHRYRVATAVHHSIESNEIPISENECLLPDELLASEDSVEATVFHNKLADDIQRVLPRLGDREREVINLRFGLLDGQEKTLEEIGQLLGVTRERIRQIESKALRKLKHPTVTQLLRRFQLSEIDRVDYEAEQLKTFLIHELSKADPTDETKYDDAYLEREQIEKLMHKYVMRGRKRVGGTRRRGERAELFKQLLENAGRPLHHTEIHEQARTLLPRQLQFAPKTTYATLFQSDYFRSFGNGVFGLSNWDNSANGNTGEHVFIHCPSPLLPINRNARSFFESIMVGRDLLVKRNPITAKEFYSEMLGWAKLPMGNVQEAQGAFDAWYAAGLVERVDFINNPSISLVLAIPQPLTLTEVRAHCLNHLCRRIVKIPELLLALERIALPSVAILQRAIFGSEHAGFDLPTRLMLLMSFEAITSNSDIWRLTEIGRNMLQKYPPEELPDFGEIEANSDEVQPIELEWEEEFGLLDF